MIPLPVLCAICIIVHQAFTEIQMCVCLSTYFKVGMHEEFIPQPVFWLAGWLAVEVWPKQFLKAWFLHQELQTAVHWAMGECVRATNVCCIL